MTGSFYVLKQSKTREDSNLSLTIIIVTKFLSIKTRTSYLPNNCYNYLTKIAVLNFLLQYKKNENHGGKNNIKSF